MNLETNIKNEMKSQEESKEKRKKSKLLQCLQNSIQIPEEYANLLPYDCMFIE